MGSSGEGTVGIAGFAGSKGYHNQQQVSSSLLQLQINNMLMHSFSSH